MLEGVIGMDVEVEMLVIAAVGDGCDSGMCNLIRLMTADKVHMMVVTVNVVETIARGHKAN